MLLKLSQLIEYQIRRIFMEKPYRKCAPKASFRAIFLISVTSSKQPLQARPFSKSIIF